MSPQRAAASSAEGTSSMPLSGALRACRSQFLLAGVFSGAANLLQLTIPLYMMQVFDRAMAARSADTLLWLTIPASIWCWGCRWRRRSSLGAAASSATCSSRCSTASRAFREQ